MTELPGNAGLTSRMPKLADFFVTPFFYQLFPPRFLAKPGVGEMTFHYSSSLVLDLLSGSIHPFARPTQALRASSFRMRAEGPPMSIFEGTELIMP